MPTTALKNTVYRIALPFLSPRPDRHCLIGMDGELSAGIKEYERLIRRHHVLGSSLLLTDGSRKVKLFTRSLNPPHDPLRQPVFRVASITKMATALLIMICVDRGTAALDDPLVQHMPPEFAHVRELDGVTLRHLLSHTSGLADPPDLEQSLEAEVSAPEVLKGQRRDPPGARFRYSNLGFGLLGCFLEFRFRKPFPKLFRELLFEPLGSRATLDASELDEDEIMPVTRIMPYHKGHDIRITPLGRRPILSPDPFLHYGHTAGSMYTDIDSLWNLIQCLKNHGKPLISPELGLEMTRVQSEYGHASPTLSYGLGVLRIRDESISHSVLLGHQGFAYGCADGAFWEESTGRTVIFLNGGCSEARIGRMGRCNRDLLSWAFRKEFPKWT